MTSWLQENLRDASWRGVPFQVNEAEKTLGQRVITHVFPERDSPFHEFLGLSPREYFVGAILIGDDLMDQVRALEEAIEQPGPGRLIHPWYGEMQAVVSRPVRVHHSTRHGRVAFLAIVFEEAGLIPSPTLRSETGAAVERAADAARVEASGGFAQSYTLVGAPDFVSASAIALLGRLADLVGAIGRGQGIAARLLTAGLGSASAALTAITEAEAEDPATVASRVFALTGAVTTAARLAAEPIDPTLRVLPQPGPSPVPPDQIARAAVETLAGVAEGVGAIGAGTSTLTTSRRTEGANQAALIGLGRAAAVTELARTAARVDWESAEQAHAARDRIAALLSDAADEAAGLWWNEAWRALTDLRVATVRDLTTRAAGLPHLARVTTPVTLPAMMVAHLLYGDEPEALFARAGDIVRRNRLSHPGFVPGGQALEVLRVQA